MRPAQKAPENSSPAGSRTSRATCFNEAGAKSAGKQGIPYFLKLQIGELQ